ncbi:MAG: serine hydrolase domain-containing protein [bacterium]
MKTKLIIVCFLFGLLGYAQEVSQKIETIDQFLLEEYPKNEPGAVVLIAKDGRIILEKAYGLASLKPKRSLKSDMVFQIGSMSKQFVSLAVLQLAEKGKIDLKAPIQNYVPYYPKKTYELTVHHLLSQTSGIPEYFDVDENEFDLLNQDYTPRELIDFYKNEPLLFKPGEKYYYSSSNYPLLGLAIENVTGQSLRDYLTTNVFNPLGMTSTGLWYRAETKPKKIAKGYSETSNGFKEGPKISSTALYAPGGVVSTAYDQFLWYKELRNREIFSDDVIDLLITEKTTLEGNGTNYGYGVALKEVQGSATIQHSGILYGFTSTGMYLPKEDIYVCVLSNTKFDRTEELANYMASVIMGNPLEIYSKSEVSAELLQNYIGTYELQSETLSRSFQLKAFDNMLVLHDPIAPKNDAFLTPSGEDRFLLKTAGAYFLFKRDENNNVHQMEITQGNDVFLFQRITETD